MISLHSDAPRRTFFRFSARSPAPREDSVESENRQATLVDSTDRCNTVEFVVSFGPEVRVWLIWVVRGCLGHPRSRCGAVLLCMKPCRVPLSVPRTILKQTIPPRCLALGTRVCCPYSRVSYLWFRFSRRACFTPELVTLLYVTQFASVRSGALHPFRPAQLFRACAASTQSAAALSTLVPGGFLAKILYRQVK